VRRRAVDGLEREQRPAAGGEDDPDDRRAQPVEVRVVAWAAAEVRDLAGGVRGR
jgi:hypothetical protein